MSTTDLERATGVKRSTWMLWYKKGIIPSPDRGEQTGRRYSKPLFDQIVRWFEESVEVCIEQVKSGGRVRYLKRRVFGL